MVKIKKELLLKDLPQLRNINQDSQMSGYFKYPMKPGYNVIGKKLANYEPDV